MAVRTKRSAQARTTCGTITRLHFARLTLKTWIFPLVITDSREALGEVVVRPVTSLPGQTTSEHPLLVSRSGASCTIRPLLRSVEALKKGWLRGFVLPPTSVQRTSLGGHKRLSFKRKARPYDASGGARGRRGRGIETLREGRGFRCTPPSSYETHKARLQLPITAGFLENVSQREQE